MGLDKGLDKSMVNACNAYMQNTPGSKKALKQIFSKKKLQKVPTKILPNETIKEEKKYDKELKSESESENENENIEYKPKETKIVEERIMAEEKKNDLNTQIKYKITVKTGEYFKYCNF